MSISFVIPRKLTARAITRGSIEKISYKFPTRFLQNCRRLDKAKIGNATDQVIAAAMRIYPASPQANRILQSPVSVVIYCGNHV